MAATKEQLRLFQTLDGKRSAAQAAAAAAATATKQREAALAAGSTPRFPFHAFYEVDSRPALQHKKQLLDELLPGWRHAAQRPRFAEVDFSSDSSLKLLLTELTGAGFDPSERCCVVAEGLLPFLSQEQASGLLADLSALAAPGSRLLFDFVHAGEYALDALLAAASPSSSGSSGSTTSGAAEAEVPPGLANLAAALANKGAPLRSGLPPSFSGLVKFLQPHNFRLSALLPPHEVARYASQQPVEERRQGVVTAASGPSSSAGSSSSSKAGGKLVAAASEHLPVVPEFYSFGSAVKQDPRLLLRHADLALATAGASEAAAGGSGYGLSAGWEAVRGAALGSPSCLLRSLAFLFCGSTTLAASCWGPEAAVAAAEPGATEAGAAAGAAGTAAAPAAGSAGGSMASAAASVAALAAEIAAAIESDFDSHSTGEGYWWMWTS
ncbi:methyltransferase [Chlorella sorokiniana]|uniref:Methyltransferase n=1 Tax=Chlorella sorokiniana TaxID=3076 RepID=A0A2P6TH01_CHLSO|nr:methyltransferase [Chlorella sorokiniana]|eukprot:PRW33577.1 methyltransferase [Chlorella sorokiniana]